MKNIEAIAEIALGLKLRYLTASKRWAWVSHTETGWAVVALPSAPAAFESRGEAVAAVAPLALAPPSRFKLIKT